MVGRRVTPNAATQSTERFNAAIAARDLDALSHELSDEVEVVHHQTGTTYGRKGLLVTWRSMFHAATMVRRHEVMASLGDALALTHHTISLEGFVEDHLTSLGAVEIDEVVLIEVDAQRRIRRFEIFPVERLGDALVRLYERYAELLPEVAQRTRIAGISRSVAAHIGAIDLDRLRLVFDPLLRCVDHRVLGTWSAGTAEEMLRHYGLQLEFAPDFGGRYADIVAANADTIAAHMVFHGTAHESGGRFENHLIAVFGFGRDGRLTQTDVFESEQGVEALTRFDELVGRGADGVENTASRTWRAVNDAWRARDVAGFEALHPRPLRYRDRRRLFQLDLDRTGFLDFTRPLLTMRDGRMSLDLVATRGERLALMRSTMEMEDDSVGPSVIESLIVIEVDDRGDIAAYDRWDLEDADAARVELDRRWSAHAIAGLAPYGRAGVGEPGQLDPSGARSATMGASERVRPAAIAKQTAAAAIWERLARSFDVEEWDAVRAACSSRFTWDDRRPLVGMTGDVELMIASARERVASGARVEHREVVGMAGDRVAVARVLWAGGPTGGRFEVEFLVVTEFGTDGLCTAMIHFDPADSRAAQREAWARWTAIDPTMAELLTNLGEVEDSWNAKDAQRLRVLFAEDLVVEDRRWTGTGRSEGRDAYLRSVTALWELAPQTHLDGGWFWLASAPHGGVYQCRRAGTLTEGGEFVSDFLCVVVVENGLATRLEVFEVEAGDAALARFEELRPDLLRVPPNAHFHALAAAAGERPVRAASDSHLDNAASRTMERFVRATDARDWQALADIFAASLRFDDRRPLLRMQLGREGFLEQHRVLFDVPNAHWTTSAIATRGEHLVLTRLILHGDVAGGGGPLEIDHLCLVEVDVDGRMIMIVLFEPENHDAAYAELDARWRVAHNEGPAPGGAC